VDVNYVDVNASVDLLKNRQTDGAQLVGGIPFGAVIDLWSAVDTRIIPIDEPDKLAALKQKYPQYYEFVIPKGTYTKQTDDIKTVAVGNLLAVKDDLPDELVYQLTKAIFENVDILIQTHSVARTIRLEDAQNGLTIPLHPGAERYLRERGVTIKPFQG
jgi:hypothetical protein